ncbi:hypothetical protein ONZ45_g4606 [Pleurotus djamor]|nr:hypothetical protein ONZ45_g4606 [Pleurotus djamor]
MFNGKPMFPPNFQAGPWMNNCGNDNRRDYNNRNTTTISGSGNVFGSPSSHYGCTSNDYRGATNNNNNGAGTLNNVTGTQNNGQNSGTPNAAQQPFSTPQAQQHPQNPFWQPNPWYSPTPYEGNFAPPPMSQGQGSGYSGQIGMSPQPAQAPSYVAQALPSNQTPPLTAEQVLGVRLGESPPQALPSIQTSHGSGSDEMALESSQAVFDEIYFPEQTSSARERLPASRVAKRLRAVKRFFKRSAADPQTNVSDGKGG